jgi:DNA-binding LacI/PurR family transcriptional regulator
MIENGVRGVAIMTSSLTEESAMLLADRDIAVVMVDLEMTRRHLSSLGVDYSKGVSEANRAPRPVRP